MPVLIHRSAAAQQAGVLTCRQGGRGLAGNDGVGLVPNEEPRSGGEVCFSTMRPRKATLRPGIGDMRAAHLSKNPSNSHYGPVNARRVRAPGLHPPQNRAVVGRVPSPGIPLQHIMRIAAITTSTT
jgi:hypothetical protein